MSDSESTETGSLPDAQAAEEAKKPPRMPAPSATGNARIAVLKHNHPEVDMARGEEFATARIDLAIRNVSDAAIATAVFEAVFFDQQGNVVDTVLHREVELDPETSRGIHINSSVPTEDYDGLGSYQVTLIRTTTTDVERVQLRRYEMRATESDEEEIRGVAKNISNAKADAAIVAIFYDPKRENIGTKVLLLNEIEPNSIRQFVFRFKPQAGDVVRSCSITVGEIVET